MSPGSIRRAWLLSAASITVLALVLRLIAISRYGFDGDEVFSLRAADSTWTHLLSVAINDKSHPPLFYAALKLWLGLAPADESWVRVLSVLFGVALLPVTAAICYMLRLSATDTALILILTAVNGLLIYLSQHARMFALFELAVMVSLLCFLNFLLNSGSKRALYLLTLANIIMVYSHYWGWFIILPQLLVTIAGYRAVLARFCMSASIVAASSLPWVVVVGMAALQQRGIAQQIAWMGSNAAGTTSYAMLFASLNGGVNFSHATTLGIVIFMAPICIFAIRRARSKDKSIWDPWSPFFWLVIIATPLIATSVTGYLAKQNLWNESHLSIVAVPYFILVGLSIASLPLSLVRTGFRCGLLAWALVASSASLADTDKQLHWENIAKEIAVRDPAPVYAAEEFIALPLEYHLERLAGRVVTVRENPNLAEISDRRFWFVYRNITWHGQQPADQLRILHDTVDARVSTRTSAQQITALLVRKDPTNTTAGAAHVDTAPNDRDGQTSPMPPNAPGLQR